MPVSVQPVPTVEVILFMFDEDMAADLFELSASDKYCIQHNGGIGLNNNNFFLLFLNFSFYNITLFRMNLKTIFIFKFVF